MRHIPLTGTVVISAREARKIAQTFESNAATLTKGAQVIETLVAERKILVEYIASQATSLELLMGLQVAMVDAITDGAAQGLSVDEIGERLSLVMSEFTA